MVGEGRRRRTGDRTGAGCMDAGQLAVMVPGLAVTTRPGSWRRGGAPLLLAEAFIITARQARAAASRPGCCGCGGGRARAENAGRLRAAHLHRALRAAGAIQPAGGDGTMGRAAG